MAKSGKVYFEKELAGLIEETDQGYRFGYDAAYLKKETAQPVSLTLPLSAQPYLSNTLFSFFDGLIPEGWLLDITAKHWKVKPGDRFELLLLACRDTIGAVTVVAEEGEETDG